MSEKRYLMQGKVAPYKIPKCEECEIIWGVKLYFDEKTSEVLSEYINFNVTYDINKEDKSYKRKMKCSRCNFEKIENAIFSTEQEFLEAIEKIGK